MRLVPRHWHNETWICSIRGHVVPAERVARLRPEDASIGADLPDGTRVARCLRCDLWLRVATPPEGDTTDAVVPPLDQLDLPRRGKPLEEAIFLGHRLVIMTSRPCKPKKILTVDIPHPRDYGVLTSPRFRELMEETSAVVHEEAKKSFAAGEREG